MTSLTDIPGHRDRACLPRSFEHPQNVVLKQILEANLDIVSSARTAADPAVTPRRVPHALECQDLFVQLFV